MVQNGVINAGEELAHIALQDIGKAPRQRLCAVQGAMGTLAEAIGIGVGDKTAFKDRLDEVAERMVHDTVTKGRGGDEASFGFVDVKVGIRARTISAVAQARLQGEQMVFETVLKGRHRWPIALAFAGTAIG